MLNIMWGSGYHISLQGNQTTAVALTQTDFNGHDLLFCKCHTMQWWVVWPKLEFVVVY